MIDVAVTLRQGAFFLDAAFSGGPGITALFGRSGTGKSTLIALIAGIRRPDRGGIRIGDSVLVDIEAGVWVPPHRRRIGLVFQDGQLFPHLTVRQNLFYGRRFRRDAQSGIDVDAVIATLGIEALLPRRPAKLSGGEKQRVALGRALLANPTLLLMDEPLASLDMARKVEILALIERVRDDFGIPIVYVSHAVEEVARLANTVVVLDQGRVVADGPPSAVLVPRTKESALATDRFSLVSVLEFRVGGYDDRYGLTELRRSAGQIFLTGKVPPRPGPVRVVIHATDVALASHVPDRVSIRNVLRATVDDVARDCHPIASVRLALQGGGHLVALATRQAVDELQLGPGKPVYALLKTVALDERPVGGVNAA
jgi:molybdate transport system ATP-binding protein